LPSGVIQRISATSIGETEKTSGAEPTVTPVEGVAVGAEGPGAPLQAAASRATGAVMPARLRTSLVMLRF